jgi:hypothetical protein
MSEQSDAAPKDPLESQTDASDSTLAEAYRVGPGCPPLNRQWKKGGPSPNPRGRPRKDQSMGPDVRKAFEQALNKKVSIARGDRKVLMTRVQIGLEQLLNQFAKGDRYARRDLMEYADKLGVDFLAGQGQALEAALTPNYQMILDAFLARRSGAADDAAPGRAVAPPELLDEDTPAESETAFSLPPDPRAKQHFPEPTPLPGTEYPKPFCQMTPLQRKIYYPEWWEEYGEAWEKHGR